MTKRKCDGDINSGTEKRLRSDDSLALLGFSTTQVAGQPTQSLSDVSSLLTLPTEVRLNVLQNLLVFSEPLHDMALDRKHGPYASRNYASAVPILATCKRLRNEGLPIFYEENCFDVILFAGCNDGDTRMILLGDEYELEQTPRKLREMRRLNVILRGWPRTMDDVETWSDRRRLHHLCATLTESMNLSHVSITVSLRYPKPMIEDNEIRKNDVLMPLAFLRKVKEARVEGVDRSHASYLESLMMRQESIENVWNMMTAFQDWCKEVTGDAETELDMDATEALYAGNIDRFKEIRKRAVRDYISKCLARILGVFHHNFESQREDDAL